MAIRGEEGEAETMSCTQSLHCHPHSAVCVSTYTSGARLSSGTETGP